MNMGPKPRTHAQAKRVRDIAKRCRERRKHDFEELEGRTNKLEEDNAALHHMLAFVQAQRRGMDGLAASEEGKLAAHEARMANQRSYTAVQSMSGPPRNLSSKNSAAMPNLPQNSQRMQQQQFDIPVDALRSTSRTTLMTSGTDRSAHSSSNLQFQQGDSSHHPLGNVLPMPTQRRSFTGNSMMETKGPYIPSSRLETGNIWPMNNQASISQLEQSQFPTPKSSLEASRHMYTSIHNRPGSFDTTSRSSSAGLNHNSNEPIQGSIFQPTRIRQAPIPGTHVYTSDNQMSAWNHTNRHHGTVSSMEPSYLGAQIPQKPGSLISSIDQSIFDQDHPTFSIYSGNGSQMYPQNALDRTQGQGLVAPTPSNRSQGMDHVPNSMQNRSTIATTTKKTSQSLTASERANKEKKSGTNDTLESLLPAQLEQSVANENMIESAVQKQQQRQQQERQQEQQEQIQQQQWQQQQQQQQQQEQIQQPQGQQGQHQPQQQQLLQPLLQQQQPERLPPLQQQQPQLPPQPLLQQQQQQQPQQQQQQQQQEQQPQQQQQQQQQHLHGLQGQMSAVGIPDAKYPTFTNTPTYNLRSPPIQPPTRSQQTPIHSQPLRMNSMNSTRLTQTQILPEQPFHTPPTFPNPPIASNIVESDRQSRYTPQNSAQSNTFRPPSRAPQSRLPSGAPSRPPMDSNNRYPFPSDGILYNNRQPPSTLRQLPHFSNCAEAYSTFCALCDSGSVPQFQYNPESTTAILPLYAMPSIPPTWQANLQPIQPQQGLALRASDYDMLSEIEQNEKFYCITTAGHYIRNRTGKITFEQPTIMYASRGFCTLMGCERAKIMKLPHSFYYHPQVDPVTSSHIFSSLAAQNELHVVLLVKSVQGDSFWVALFCAPLREQHGHIVHYVMVIRPLADHYALSFISAQQQAALSGGSLDVPYAQPSQISSHSNIQGKQAMVVPTSSMMSSLAATTTSINASSTQMGSSDINAFSTHMDNSNINAFSTQISTAAVTDLTTLTKTSQSMVMSNQQKHHQQQQKQTSSSHGRRNSNKVRQSRSTRKRKANSVSNTSNDEIGDLSDNELNHTGVTSELKLSSSASSSFETSNNEMATTPQSSRRKQSMKRGTPQKSNTTTESQTSKRTRVSARKRQPSAKLMESGYMLQSHTTSQSNDNQSKRQEETIKQKKEDHNTTQNDTDIHGMNTYITSDTNSTDSDQTMQQNDKNMIQTSIDASMTHSQLVSSTARRRGQSRRKLSSSDSSTTKKSNSMEETNEKDETKTYDTSLPMLSQTTSMTFSQQVTSSMTFSHTTSMIVSQSTSTESSQPAIVVSTVQASTFAPGSQSSSIQSFSQTQPVVHTLSISSDGTATTNEMNSRTGNRGGSTRSSTIASEGPHIIDNARNFVAQSFARDTAYRPNVRGRSAEAARAAALAAAQRASARVQKYYNAPQRVQPEQPEQTAHEESSSVDTFHTDSTSSSTATCSVSNVSSDTNSENVITILSTQAMVNTSSTFMHPSVNTSGLSQKEQEHLSATIADAAMLGAIGSNYKIKLSSSVSSRSHSNMSHPTEHVRISTAASHTISTLQSMQSKPTNTHYTAPVPMTQDMSRAILSSIHHDTESPSIVSTMIQDTKPFETSNVSHTSNNQLNISENTTLSTMTNTCTGSHGSVGTMQSTQSTATNVDTIPLSKDIAAKNDTQEIHMTHAEANTTQQMKYSSAASTQPSTATSTQHLSSSTTNTQYNIQTNQSELNPFPQTSHPLGQTSDNNNTSSSHNNLGSSMNVSLHVDTSCVNSKQPTTRSTVMSASYSNAALIDSKKRSAIQTSLEDEFRNSNDHGSMFLTNTTSSDQTNESNIDVQSDHFSDFPLTSSGTMTSLHSSDDSRQRDELQEYDESQRFQYNDSRNSSTFSTHESCTLFVETSNTGQTTDQSLHSSIPMGKSISSQYPITSTPMFLSPQSSITGGSVRSKDDTSSDWGRIE